MMDEPSNPMQPPREQALEDFRKHSSSRQLVRQSSMKHPNSTRTLLKSVSFDDRPPLTRPIEPVKNRREIQKRWMSARDFRKIHSENNATLSYLEQHAIPTKEFTTRGLERHTEMGMCQYRENHRDAVLAVLQQQDVIWRSSSDLLQASEEDTIARAYREETEHSQRKATLLARRDEQEVDEYLADCTLERIRQEQQRQHLKHESNKSLVKRLLVKPAMKLTKSLSLRSIMNPQA